MKRVLFIFIAVIFILISGCLGDNKNAQNQTNTDFTKPLKNILDKSPDSVDISKAAEGGITENVGGDKGNLLAKAETNEKPVVPENKTVENKGGLKPLEKPDNKLSANENTNQAKPLNNIAENKNSESASSKPEEKNVLKKNTKDEPVINEKNTQKTLQKENTSDKKIEAPENNTVISIPEKIPNKVGSYIKVGDDNIGQAFSPRYFIKTTYVVFESNKNAATVDFLIYAVPKNAKVKKYNYYLFGVAYGIEVVNGQSQFTRFWNGINYNGDYLSKGNYNIYLTYTVKDRAGNILKTDERFWGGNQNYYIKLN